MTYLDRRGSSILRHGALKTFFLGLLLVPLFSLNVAGDDIVPPYHNQVLRKYYRSLLLGTYSYWIVGDARHRFVDNGTIDRRIDLLIEDFTRKLIEKLSSLEARQNQVEAQRIRLLETSESEREPAMRQWKDQLEVLEDAADDLRDYLIPILYGVDSKSEFTPRVSEDDLAGLFADQTRLLRVEVNHAQREIHNLFLEPTFIIEAESLKKDNILIALHRTEKMAEALKKFIEGNLRAQ